MSSASTSDVLHIIRNASECLYPFKSHSKSRAEKKVTQNNIRELYKQRSDKAEELDLSTKFTEWLKSLDKCSVNQILTHKNQFISTFIQESYYLTVRQGSHNFKLKESQPRLEPQNSVFYMVEFEKKKLSELDTPQNTIEKELEKIIRFTDREKYCDCLSLDPSIDGNSFLALAKQAETRCFKVPCRVSWELHTNTWIWDYPHWFVPGTYYGFSYFALASFERAAWMRFWEVHQLDPRSGDSKPYKHVQDPSGYNLEELSVYLASLGTDKQKEIVGDKATHNEISSKIVLNSDSIQSIQLKQIISDPPSYVVFYPLRPPNSFSIDLISDKFDQLSTKTFLEFLHYSTLDRLGSSFDLVAKKVLLNVVSALSEKKAEDLMKEAKIEEPKHLHKKKSKKPKNRKEKKKSESDLLKETAEDVVNNIISELEENPEFQVKKHFSQTRPVGRQTLETIQPVVREKHAERPPVSYKPKQPCRKEMKKPIKRPHSSQTKVPSNQSTPKGKSSKTSLQVTPTKPEPSQKFKWSKANAQPCSLDNFEFPPLSSAAEPVLSSLHHEILKYASSVKKKVSSKFESFKPTLEKIFYIIYSLHPDSLVSIFGSYGSELAIESSDIDLLVTLPGLPSRQEIQFYCVELAKEIEISQVAKQSKAIPTARVPIVKIEVGEYLIDISYEDLEYSHQGINVMNLVRQSTAAYPGLREVTLVFKQLLYQNNLNCSFMGGLNTYGLFLWILCYFQSNPTELDLGKIVEGFLDIFSTFDPKTTKIDVRDIPGFIPVESSHYENVITVDPMTGYNITAGLFQFSQIHSLFNECVSKIKSVRPPNLKSIFSSFKFK